MSSRKSCLAPFRYGLQVVFLLSISLFPATLYAQYAKLFDFGNQPEGYRPFSPPVTDNTFLYGMTSEGGTHGQGTIYKMKLDGTGFTTLLHFDGSNGGSPFGSLFYDGTSLYGMTTGGGTNNIGVIFKIETDGSGYTKLFDFDQPNGAGPRGSFVSDGTFLYGVAGGGGSNFVGTLFKLKKDGTGFTKLHDFNLSADGAYPYGTLYYDGTFLYGTASQGGTSSSGTVFKIKPDGTGFLKLVDFDYNTNGATPYGSLISDGTYLYGTALTGGPSTYGLVFRLKKDGSSFSSIRSFSNSALTGGAPKGSLLYDGTYLYGSTTDFGANARGVIFKMLPDGSGFVKLADNDVGTSNSNPEGDLISVGSTLYGVKSGNGAGAAPFYPGTIFKINTDGSGYAKLHYFEKESVQPSASLFYDGTFLYGTSTGGGLFDYGTIFKIKPDGSGYTKLLDFIDTNGKNPYSTLISDGTFLYGTTLSGGANDQGTIFKIKPDGTGFNVVFSFSNPSTGIDPYSSLITDGIYLYGMASNAGGGSSGTIFKVKTDGTGFVVLHDLDYINDGGYPRGALFNDGTYLYGMTSQGGADGGWGTIFKIKPDGSGFTKLFDFDNSGSGGNPYGALISDGSFLYGLTTSGGTKNAGTMFKIKTDGTSFTKLLDFADSLGTSPYGSLFSDGTYLYGMTSYGGILQKGTVFRIKPDGTGFLTMYNFDDGSYAQGDLISDGTSLYGMTMNGGSNSGQFTTGDGILFKISKTPFVSITSFTPAQGVIGTEVLIEGTYFDPNAAGNVVKFNGVTAQVLEATATTLKVIVPPGATTGPISVTAHSSSATSVNDFVVTNSVEMFNGIVHTCNTDFTFNNGPYAGLILTFVPDTPGNKIKVSFSKFNVGDMLNVYDGPDTSYTRVGSFSQSTLPNDITATGAGGELTFEWVWQDSGTDFNAKITCVSTAPPPVTGPTISTTQLATKAGGSVSLDLVSLITIGSGALDLSSLQVVVQPPSGATASIDAQGKLTVDYSGRSFTGTESVTVKACDVNGNCATQDIQIVVTSDALKVYNGVSPNNNYENYFRIENIDVLPDTRENTVYIFDRWQNPVWHGSNYNNDSVVFKGIGDNGSELPSGVYFYKVEFSSGRKSLTGFISVRR